MKKSIKRAFLVFIELFSMLIISILSMVVGIFYYLFSFINRKIITANTISKFWAWFLSFVNKDNLKKALENKEKKDLEAWNRIEKLKNK